MKDHQNVTLSLPKPLLQRFKVYAARSNKSMSALLTEAIQKMVPFSDEEREKAKRRLLASLANPPDLGTGGKITWTRDELHER
jgi:hypothetical protein